MKKCLLFLIATGATLGLVHSVHAQQFITLDGISMSLTNGPIVAKTLPPVRLQGQIGPICGAKTKIPGYHAWNGTDWTWIESTCQTAPLGHEWAGPVYHWDSDNHHCVYVAPRWVPSGWAETWTAWQTWLPQHAWRWKTRVRPPSLPVSSFDFSR